MTETTLHRILGGSPATVLIKLLVLSLLVGAALSWLDVDLLALANWLQRWIGELWRSGFQALRQTGGYVATGAAVVIPVWALMRLLSIGSRETGRAQAARWSLPGAPEPGSDLPRTKTERKA